MDVSSIKLPFLGDYVRLRQNPQWRKNSIETNDQYVVFADIINKINRSSGKVLLSPLTLTNYRVSHLVVHLGWVDFDLDIPPCCPAA